MQQSTIPTPAQAPQAPQPYIVQVPRGALTGQEVQALLLRQKDLRVTLQDAAVRRRVVADQLRGADARALPGLEQRLRVIDERVIQSEMELNDISRQLASAPAAAMVAAKENMPPDINIPDSVGDNLVALVSIIAVFLFAPIGIGISRFLWKRASGEPRRSGAAPVASQQRLDQLQRSIDTIAIEVERISEGQRFVTKVLAERDKSTKSLAEVAEPR